MAIDTRQRDKTGEIGRKHGNTLIRTLRKSYGQSFAGACGNKKKLDDVLNKLDEPSLTRLIHDHEAGHLDASLPREASRLVSDPTLGLGAPNKHACRCVSVPVPVWG